MLRKSFLNYSIAVFTLLGLLVGCGGDGKAPAGKENRPSTTGPLTPSRAASAVEGRWQTNCFDRIIRRADFTGDVIVYYQKTYANEGCSGNVVESRAWTSRFTLTQVSSGVYTHSIAYHTGDFAGIVEKIALTGNLAFEELPMAFLPLQ